MKLFNTDIDVAELLLSLALLVLLPVVISSGGDYFVPGIAKDYRSVKNKWISQHQTIKIPDCSTEDCAKKRKAYMEEREKLAKEWIHTYEYKKIEHPSWLYSISWLLIAALFSLLFLLIGIYSPLALIGTSFLVAGFIVSFYGSSYSWISPKNKEIYCWIESTYLLCSLLLLLWQARKISKK